MTTHTRVRLRYAVKVAASSRKLRKQFVQALAVQPGYSGATACADLDALCCVGGKLSDTYTIYAGAQGTLGREGQRLPCPSHMNDAQILGCVS